MKHVVSILGVLAASPVFAHSGEHVHPHGATTWIAVGLAAVVVGGTMTLVQTQRRK